MRIFLPALLLIFAAQPAHAAERRYSVTDFDRVQIDGPYRVTLTTGGSPSARASGASAALDRVNIEVQGRTLRIRTSQSAWGGDAREASSPVTIALTVRELHGAAVNGSGSFTADKARGMRVDVSLAGGGQATVAIVESDALFVNMLGSGTVKLGGKAKTMRAEIHGSASFDGAALTVDDAQIFANTAGQTKVGVRRAATVRATGVGDVEITGSPACTIKSSGVGQVRCGKN